MRISDWQFGGKKVKGKSKAHTAPEPKRPIAERTQSPEPQLLLEGTRFPLFIDVCAFFQECRRSGQAALVITFSDFWHISSLGYQEWPTNKETRLLCASCIREMPMSFRFGLGGWPNALISGVPSSILSAAAAAVCPYCASRLGILLWDHPPYGEITEQDIEALRELWRFRCELWWDKNDHSHWDCALCDSRIPRGEGYHLGSEVICEECAKEMTGPEALSELRNNPDRFGTSELRRARNFKFSGWRFEPDTTLNWP